MRILPKNQPLIFIFTLLFVVSLSKALKLTTNPLPRMPVHTHREREGYREMKEKLERNNGKNGKLVVAGG